MKGTRQRPRKSCRWAKAHLELVRDLVIERAEHVCRQVHKRIVQDKDDVLVDLGDEAGRRLRVTALGWQVEPGGEDILFRRGKGYGAIEVPDVASDAREAWQWLEPLLDFRQRDTRNRTIVVEIEAIQGGFKRRSDAANEINQALGKIRSAVLFFISAYRLGKPRAPPRYPGIQGARACVGIRLTAQ